MKTKKPRYVVEHGPLGWLVVDNEQVGCEKILAVLQSEQAARSVCESLNRGLCGSVAPDGRWT